MKRREFIRLAGGAAAWPLAARAQRAGKIPRIGVLWHAGSPAEEAIFLAALRQGLADFGYVEGKNIVVEHRFPAEMPERFRSMAAELTGLNLDVLVAAGQPPALALQQATSTIPIVFVAAYDPLAVGLVTCTANWRRYWILASRSHRQTVGNLQRGSSQSSAGGRAGECDQSVVCASIYRVQPRRCP